LPQQTQMSATIRVAVAGLAHCHARRHIQARLQADATIACVSDGQPAMAESVAGALECSAYADCRATVEDRDPDFAWAIGQPNETSQIARYPWS